MIDLLRCLLGILGGRGLLICQNDIRGQCVVSFGVNVWVRSTGTSRAQKHQGCSKRVRRVREVGEAYEVELWFPAEGFAAS